MPRIYRNWLLCQHRQHHVLISKTSPNFSKLLQISKRLRIHDSSSSLRSSSCEATPPGTGTDAVSGWAIWITLVIVCDFFGSMIEVAGWFPGPFVGIVANPVDKVFQFTITNSRVQDLLDFVFQDVFNCHGWRRRLGVSRNSVRVVRIEEAGVEDRMDLHLGGKVQLKRHFALADDFEYFVGTQPFVVEFRRGASCRDILPR